MRWGGKGGGWKVEEVKRVGVWKRRFGVMDWSDLWRVQRGEIANGKRVSRVKEEGEENVDGKENKGEGSI